ncbi:corticotropin-releasing factor-binding protein [Prorops nasuta]|uniref:corticotropin-releasing factor-binding protein n=1 Tax=Prorops nasuta TaxID=863751 RepID=UPI0034CE7ADE
MFVSLVKISLLLVVSVLYTSVFTVDASIKASSARQQQIHDHSTKDWNMKGRQQNMERLLAPEEIEECLHVVSSSGVYRITAANNNPTVCALYFMSEPNQKIDLYFLNFNVPCEQENLVGVVDGWELNGEFFPSEVDHELLLQERSTEFCDVIPKKEFLSSQNAALIQYRIVTPGYGFTVYARFVNNPTPCNILQTSLTEELTLRNYGRRSNCSLTAVYPASVHIIAHDVGITSALRPVRTKETGTLHECAKDNSLRDVVQIGGSAGLDTTNLEVIDSFCGISSKPNLVNKLVNAEVTTVRLISSGLFENSVTVSLVQILQGDPNMSV